MKSLLSLLAVFSPVCLVFAAEGEAPASTPGGFRRASLIERPPFARVETSTRTVSGPLELRGFFGAGDNLEVSLTKPSTKESLWVRVGDKTAKWVVDSADVDAGTAEVRYDGMTLNLTLAKAEIPPPAPATPAPAVATAATTEERPRPANNNAMSREGREAMSKARRELFTAARTEHPEYFDGTQLSEAQQQARSAYMASLNDKVRAAVVAVNPEDAEKMNGGGFGGPGGQAGGQPQGNRTVDSGAQGANNPGGNRGQRQPRGGNN